jgi:hypothetical protein
LATLVLASVIGLVIWVRSYLRSSVPPNGNNLSFTCSKLVFAIVRRRFRHVYAVREWFVPSE